MIDKGKAEFIHITFIPTLPSLHQRCSVNTWNKDNTQYHSFHNAPETGEQTNKDVEEKEEVRYDRIEPSEKKNHLYSQIACGHNKTLILK